MFKKSDRESLAVIKSQLDAVQPSALLANKIHVGNSVLVEMKEVLSLLTNAISGLSTVVTEQTKVIKETQQLNNELIKLMRSRRAKEFLKVFQKARRKR